MYTVRTVTQIINLQGCTDVTYHKENKESVTNNRNYFTTIEMATRNRITHFWEGTRENYCDVYLSE